MTNKRKTRLALGLILAVVFFLFIYQFSVMNKIKQGGPGTNLEKQKSAEKIDEERARMGWNKMIGGELILADIENEKIEIDVDPLGESKKYEINFNKKTEILELIFELAQQQEQQNQDDDNGERLEQNYKETFQKKSPSDLIVGKNVEVFFPERIDLTSAKILNAEKIIILPSQQ